VSQAVTKINRAHARWIAKRVTIAVLLALAVSGGVAQGQGIFGRGAAFFGAGISGIGTGALDDRLAARGYPAFGRTATGVTLGAYHILPGGLTVGGEWHGLIIGDGMHQGRNVGIGGGYGTLGLGYIVELSPRTRLYPRIGIGGGGLGMWFESDSVVGFDDVLADPQPVPDADREPVLSHGSVVLDLGLGAELLPGGAGRGLMVGLRVGYLAAPSSGDWQLYDHDVSGGPRVTLAGPYIRGVVGIARRR
jgi:hypothetical protein